jgi:4-hydroxybenzoate polyprenyltransferase
MKHLSEFLAVGDRVVGRGVSLRAHLEIARVDHWIKNVFVLPGIVVALGIEPHAATAALAVRVLVGLLAVCLVTSSNYVLNEVMDAPFDRHHPAKCKRPVPSGRVHVPLAYLQWIALMLIGLALGLTVSGWFAVTVLVLWMMGCLYNVPPARTKDVAYLDVLSEAANNPLRMLAGWFIVSSSTVAPASLLLSYWMVGCYFMAMKRYAEYRDLGDPMRAAAYRRSFAVYTEERLLVSVMFYGAAAMLFFGAFLMRYRFELVLSFPLVALVMSTYLALAFKPHSAVANPELLYRERALVGAVVACAAVMIVCLFVDVPALDLIFSPTAPTWGGALPR